MSNLTNKKSQQRKPIPTIVIFYQFSMPN